MCRAPRSAAGAARRLCRLCRLWTGAIGSAALLLLVPAPCRAADAPAGEAGPIFVDRAAEWGLGFVHFNGMTGKYYFPEMTGQGAGLVDYDGDGDLDAYLVQGAMLGPGETLADALVPPVGPVPPVDRLFRNDLVETAGGALEPHFVDVTGASGLDARGYGMGVAAGDYDGDGRVDLYVTDYGSNQLWHNEGDGTFTDVTARAGVDDPRWSVSAAFLDYDGDGRLDLYVGNYLAFDVAKDPLCFNEAGRRDYCGPADFAGVSDRLFHNRGDGTFADVSAASGVGRPESPGLGVVTEDFDGDGKPDLYVTNDGRPNFLWINRGDGTFRDDGLLAGVALNREGTAEASMGVDAGDFDGDGDPDLFMTHLTRETNTLYVNEGGGLFEDRTLESGLAAPSFPYTSFGTSWIDYDNDGWLDLVVLNGAVQVLEPEARAGDPYPLKQPNQLFHALGGRGFEEVSAAAGPAFALAEVSRGAACGDVDLDGDLDVLEANNDGPARLLVDQVGQDRSWMAFDLVDAHGAPALGARVEVERPGAPGLRRRARADGSYASANAPGIVVGLGAGGRVSAVKVVWPDGREQRFEGLEAGRRWRLEAPGGGGAS